MDKHTNGHGTPVRPFREECKKVSKMRDTRPKIVRDFLRHLFSLYVVSNLSRST